MAEDLSTSFVQEASPTIKNPGQDALLCGLVSFALGGIGGIGLVNQFSAVACKAPQFGTMALSVAALAGSWWALKRAGRFTVQWFDKKTDQIIDSLAPDP